MNSSIEVLVLGDYGPFSEQGKSIGYQVFINGDGYLVDLGAPLFQQIGGVGIGQVNGAIITHCHDDHKRWFTDVALYYKYAPSLRRKLKLFTNETVIEGVRRSAGPALNQSLDAHSKTVVDISFDEYVDHIPVGPRAKYRIGVQDDPESARRWHVVDAEGVCLGPDRAKIVLSRQTGMPRMLFRDPDTHEWVEPESYYPYSSPVFYEQDTRPIVGDGYRIEIINAPVWHGLPNFGLVIEANGERLIFSSDTMHNLPLWQSLVEEKRTPAVDLESPAFLEAGVLIGDINDYIERIWSRARYDEALRAFDGAAVIHDVTGRFGVVHTEYHGLPETVLDPARTLLTHSPDRFSVVGWQLMKAGKRYRVLDNHFVEVDTQGALWPIDADVYHKFDGRFFAGHKHDAGRYYVYEKAAYHSVSDGPDPTQGDLLFRANLFEDVNGCYLPHQGIAEQFYTTRPDGRIERVLRHENGSHGVIVDNLRQRRREMAPDELERLAHRPVTVPPGQDAPSPQQAGSLQAEPLQAEQLQAELRELQRTLSIMRERLELQVAEHQDNIQKAVAGAQAEIQQLKETAAALRDAMEREVAAREGRINEAVKTANAEIIQLRDTASALRDEIEKREVAAANRQQEAVSAAQQEAIQLRAAVASLRDQLDALREKQNG